MAARPASGPCASQQPSFIDVDLDNLHCAVRDVTGSGEHRLDVSMDLVSMIRHAGAAHDAPLMQGREGNGASNTGKVSLDAGSMTQAND